MVNSNIPADKAKRTDSGFVQMDSQIKAESEDVSLQTNVDRISRLLLWMLVFISPMMGIGYLVTGAVQYAIIFGYTAFSLLTLAFARRFVKRGRYRLSAYIFVFDVLFVSLAVHLTMSGLTLALVIETLVFTNVLGSLTLPRRYWWHSLTASVIVSVLMVLSGVFGTPWQRFSIESAAGISATTYGVIGLAILVILGELFMAYRRIVRLSVRLSVIFGAVVFVALTLTIVVSLIVITNATQTQAFDALETTSQLKRNAIQTWVGTLNSELGTVLVESYEKDRARAVLLEEGSIELQRTSLNELRTRMQNVVERNFNFLEIYLINPDGQVIVDSVSRNEDKWVDHEPYFIRGSNSVYIDQPRFSLSDEGLVMVFSQPIYDQLGYEIGVIAGKANLAKLNSLISASASGISGKTYLVAGNHELLDEHRYLYSEGIDTALRGETGTETYEDYDGVTVLGYYQRLPEFNAALINEIDRDEVLQTGRRGILLTNSITTIGIEVLAVFAAILVSQSITRALSALVGTAERVAAGEHALRAEIVADDEVGMLARAFNSMTDQLQEFIAGLEQRVQERTDGLAAVGEVTRATASELDISQLLPSVVNTVRERFNLYYVGLFLAEEQQDGTPVAILRAATGDAGRQMIAQNWQLAVDRASMIGDSIFTGQPRVRQSSTESGPWQRNRYLPDTESELALPLRFGGRVLGSMTVQSTVDNAFDDTTIDLLQNMADQVAVAIENARLYTESQQALAQARLIQQRYQTRSWRDYLTAQDVRGIAYSDVMGAEKLGFAQTEVQALPDGVVVEEGKLLIPIMQGTQQVGVMGFEGKAGGWRPEEIELLQALTEQLSQAAENQRLLDETEQRAAREQTVAQVADSLRQSLDMEMVLSTAATEIRQALGLERIVVRLAEPEQSE